MTINKIPTIAMLLPKIDKSTQDIDWFNDRFGKAIAFEITCYLYKYACEIDESSYFSIDAYIEVINKKNAKIVHMEKAIEEIK